MTTFRRFLQKWKQREKGTQHTHGPNFGKHVEGCPRCHELKNGSKPRSWGPSRASQDAQRVREIKAHFDSEHHKSGKCGPVCTFGDW